MIQDAARIVSRLTGLKCQAIVAKDWFFDLSMFYVVWPFQFLYNDIQC